MIQLFVFGLTQQPLERPRSSVRYSLSAAIVGQDCCEVKLRTLARCIAYVDFVRPGPRLCVRTALPALQRVTGDHSQIVVYCHRLESIDHTW